MYMPAFLPCPRCNAGPNMEFIQLGRGGVISKCSCGFCTVGYTNNKNLTVDEQLEIVNRAWNQLVREKPTVEQKKVNLKPITEMGD